MNPQWTVIALVGAATIAMKGAGPVLLGGRALPPRVLRVLRLLAPALLAALVVTQTFVSAGRLVLDPRSLGVAAAFVALAAGVPTLAAVIVAAVVTAVARLIV
jgi:branched-subunit amino acid transport protein